MKPSQHHVRESFTTALPIMLGYVAIGIPCGILSASVGMNAVQVFLLCALFYSGAGQFMIPNMWATATPLASIIASVTLINTRQMLYSASLSQFCQKAKKRLAFLFAATVTDESYGVNMLKFEEAANTEAATKNETEGEALTDQVKTAKRSWSLGRATMVNLFSQSSWTISSVIGVLLGNALSIPLALASFAMTSIFICLLCTQKITPENVVAALVAVVGVVLCKCIGLSGPAILVGALLGVLVALLVMLVREKRTAQQ